MAEQKKGNSNGLRRALDERIVESLTDLAELRGEFHSWLRGINEKIDRLLVLQEKVERNSVAIARLKTVAALLAAGVAFVVSCLKSWLFGGR